MRFLSLVLLCLFCEAATARPPDGGGPLPVPTHGDDRLAIEQALQRAQINADKLKADRGPVLEAVSSEPTFTWPFRKSIVVSDPALEAVSNYLDQDEADESVLDYNCGDRTYDGHRGLDIYTTPFSWYKMERDHGIVVAAAAGMIVEKVDDQPERSCSIDDPAGGNNQIVLEHADGSLSLYAHMRTGSLNAKAIGARVSAGEYLGVVGSAGNSTGPHLHFETGSWVLDGDQYVWTPADPFAGSCNGLNVESSWEIQPDYYQSVLNAIATHSAAPEVPACPETEMPHYSDSFMAGDTVFLAAYYRDQLAGQNSHFRITRPNGSTAYEWDHSSTAEHAASIYWYWRISLPASAQSGEWLFEVTYEEQSLEHRFYVDAAPPPAPVMPESNNAYNGAWYDPSLEGEGYNILTADSGTVVYFYGSDSDGERLWLISDVVPDVIVPGRDVTFVMYESTGGTFARPVSSTRGLSVWGELTYNFADCNNGTAFLSGLDGEKNTNIVKIIGVSGTNCTGQASADGPLAGAWFEPASSGEGFNILVTPLGTVVYFYGFDSKGNRLWLISGLIEATLQAGQQVTTGLFKAVSGTFSAPTPSEQSLADWGTLRIDVVDCNHFTITTDTLDGFKTSATIKIAGVVGLSCVD